MCDDAGPAIAAGITSLFFFGIPASLIAFVLHYFYPISSGDALIDAFFAGCIMTGIGTVTFFIWG